MHARTHFVITHTHRYIQNERKAGAWFAVDLLCSSWSHFGNFSVARVSFSLGSVFFFNLFIHFFSSFTCCCCCSRNIYHSGDMMSAFANARCVVCVWICEPNDKGLGAWNLKRCLVIRCRHIGMKINKNKDTATRNQTNVTEWKKETNQPISLWEMNCLCGWRMRVEGGKTIPELHSMVCIWFWRIWMYYFRYSFKSTLRNRW